MPPETNSNDFGRFLELSSQFEYDFRRRVFFLNDSNFWCVQNSITHNAAVHVPVLWPFFAPTQFQFECCGVLDNSRQQKYMYISLTDVAKKHAIIMEGQGLLYPNIMESV